MASKRAVTQIKLQAEAGKATPAPPVGPALGQHGLNIADFCKQFNDRTQKQAGMKIPVIITVYTDRSFSFITKSPPASLLIKKELSLDKGSPIPHINKVGSITRAQLESIASMKKEDLNSRDMDAAIQIISGTCRSMGVDVKE